MKSKELKEIQNELAKIWFDNKTKENAENVIKSFEGLTKWFANKKHKKFPRYGFNEFANEIRFGIFEALLHFDGQHKFTSYVNYWIIRRLQLFTEKMVPDLNYGRCDKRRYLLKHYKPMYWQFKSENPNLSIDEIHKLIAEKCDTTVRVVERMYWEKQQNKSFDDYLINSNNILTHEVIADETALNEDNIIDLIDSKKLKLKINKRFINLDERDKEILWGMILEEESFESISKKYGVSRQCIGQRKQKIEKKFKKFKKAM